MACDNMTYSYLTLIRPKKLSDMQSLQASLQCHSGGWKRCHNAQHAAHCHRTGRQLHIPCRAAATAAKQAEAERIAEELPQSKEAAVSGLFTAGAPACSKPGRLLIALQIQQAAAAVSAQLAGLGKKRKGFQSGSIKRLKLDVLQADDRPQAVRMGPCVRVSSGNLAHHIQACFLLLQVTALAQDWLRQLPEELESQLTVLFCNDKVAEHASQHSSLKGRCKSLGDAFVDSLSGPLLIVGPTVDQVSGSCLLLTSQEHHRNSRPPLCWGSANNRT